MNDKVKAQWMAQYLGQRMEAPTDHKPRLTGIYTHPDNYVAAPLNIHSRTWYEIKDCCLLLRTVDMLTNEELKIIANHIGLCSPELEFKHHPNRITVRDDSYTLYLFFDCVFQTLKNMKPYIDTDLSKVYQLVLRFGILLPFTYLNESNQPETLTSAQLVEMGWAKIKTA